MKKRYLLLLSLMTFLLPAHVLAEKKVPILVYHSIDEYKGQGSKELYVTPENFEKQILYLRDHGYTLLTFEQWNDIPKVNKPIFITLDDGYKNNINVYLIFQKLQNERFTPKATLFVISDFINRPNRLSSIELKKLSNSRFFSIQSHTATHPDLTIIKDYQHELQGSKERIQHITGKKVMALAYPYGNVNEQIIAEMKKYYSYGVTTTPQIYYEKGEKNDHYTLPRLYIKYSTTITDFSQIINGNVK